MLNFKNYKSILCLDGDLPHSDFFNSPLPIIAADGAANRLAKMNIKPSIIIGDLDSADPRLLKEYPHLHLPSQDTSDYQKCLVYLSDQQLMPSIVVGINGGYLDHILNNINLFLGTNCLMYAPPIMGFCLKAGTEIELTSVPNNKLSLIGIPHAVVSTAGLKWELQAESLTFPGKTSCFNRVKDYHFKIAALEGQLLVLLYQSEMDDAGGR